MTTIYNKNEEKVVISVDKLSKICWENSLKKKFEVFFLSLKRLLSTLPKDIKKAQRHGSRPHQSGIFEYLYKTTFNS
jgi:hypothetical protein